MNEIEELIERYVAGDLSDEERDRVEELALANPKISAMLDAALRPTADAFRDLYPAVEPDPDTVRKLRESKPKARRSSGLPWWSGWGIWISLGVAACAFALIAVGMGRFTATAPPLTAIPAPSRIVLDAIVTPEAGGSQVLVAAGGNPYRAPGMSISSNLAFADFRLRSDSRGPYLDLLSGALVVMSSVSVRVKAGAIEVSCSGGEFGVDYFGKHAIRISAYRKNVEWTNGRDHKTVFEGRWTEGPNQGFIDDDPAQSAQHPPELVCPAVLLPTGAETPSLKISVELDSSPRDQLWLHKRLEDISLRPDDPVPYEEVALMYAKARLRRHAGYVLERALALDPQLAHMTQTADLEYLMRAVGQPWDRQELDQPELVSELAGILEHRDPSRGKYYRAFATMISFDAASHYDHEDECNRLFAAAEQLAAYAGPEDLLPLSESMYRSGMHRADMHISYERVRRAADGLRAYVKLPGLSTRELAEGYERLGETLFWDPPRHRESLEMTTKAISLWSRPHWLVHFAARQVECGVADYRSYKMLVAGLGAAPSPDSYIRAVPFFGLTATTPAEYKLKDDLAEWLGRTYNNVGEATATGAQFMYPDRIGSSFGLFKRYIQLEGLDNIGDDQRATMAIEQWKLERDAGGRPDADAIVKSLKLISDDKVSQKLPFFYAEIGDFSKAMKYLADDSPLNELAKGMYANRLGDKETAIRAYRNYLDGKTWTRDDCSNVAEARVGIAELTSAEKAREELRGNHWEDGIDVDHYQGFRYHPQSAFYEARLHWAAGDRKIAVRLMGQYLAEYCGDRTGVYQESFVKQWGMTPGP